MKINEIVVFYIDKTEIQWPTVDPKYSTLHDISKRYSFMLMRGHGRVASRRYCCWCDACCLAHESESNKGMTPLLDIPECKRRHLTCFKGSEDTISCTAQSGLANAKARAKALWAKLKLLLKVGKYAAVQARELWSTEERVHLRPGHFWVCELGDVDGKGSPVAHIFSQKNEVNVASDGQKYRGDEGECLLLIRYYYHRMADDASDLTCMRLKPKKGEVCCSYGNLE